MVDLDGDGRRDLISGSYWPGDLFLFREQADGTYAKGTPLLATSGDKVNAGPKWETENTPQMDSLAAAPHAADLDGDGDLDLLVGNIAGRVIWIPNQGDAKNPKFHNEGRRTLEADGAAIQVPGGDAGPFVTDWDRDGVLDLIVGAGDGSVWYYRNEGTRREAKFAAGVALLPKSKYDYENPAKKGEPLTSHGTRTKVCAADLDGDGWDDLLVGDFLSVERPAPELTEAQTARRDALRAEMETIQESVQERYAALEADGKMDDPNHEDAQLTDLFAEMDRVYRELSPLEPGNDMHGHVWALIRVPSRGEVSGR